MSTLLGQRQEERELIQECLAGESDALTMFRSTYVQPLGPMLIQRGAQASEVDDLLASLWTDCVVGRAGRIPLLEKYNGKSALRTWLFRIGFNLYLDRLRRTSKLSYLPTADSEEPLGDRLGEFGAVPTTEGDSALTGLLSQSLRAAFEGCPPDDLLRLRLVYLHGLTHREVGRMWGCHEATIGRDLSRAMQFIADRTLGQVKKIDPRLKLSWDDFLELCDAGLLDFF